MSYNSGIGSKCTFVLRLWWIVSVVLTLSNASYLFGRELPCHFYDSINITDGVRHPNESITFNGIEYSPEQYVEVNYILRNGTVPVKVIKPYIRGCLCNNRPCIRLCCPYGSFVDEMNNGNGIKCRENESAKHIESEITTKNNQTNIVSLDEHFAFIDRICNLHSVAKDFKIHEDGYISNEFGGKNYKEYCLKVSANEANEPNLELMMCMDQPEKFKFKTTKLYMMLASAFFMAITFIVYISLPELLNFHGKCFLCFLVCLTIVFISYPWIRFSQWNYVPFSIREAFACLMYFCTLSACLWVNVICFDLWLHFRSMIRTRRFSERMQLFLSAIYACGLPMLLLVVDIHVTKPFGSIIGYYQNGRIRSGSTKEKYDRLQILFYFLPLGIIFSANILLFILTAFKIYRAKRNIKMILSQGKSSGVQEIMKKNSDSFTCIFRMFILMGIEGIVETFKAIISSSHKFFFFTDICIAAHGIILFILFVLRPRVFKLIRKKLTKSTVHIKSINSCNVFKQ